MKRYAKYMFIIVIAGLTISPMILTICNSFMSEAEINMNYGAIYSLKDSGGKTYISERINLHFIPDRVSIEQYRILLLNTPDYLIRFWNSVIYVFPIVFFQLIVALLASYGFARYGGKIKKIIFFAYIILMLMPYQVTILPNFIASKWLNILNTRFAIWLPGIFSPLSIYIITKYMQRIPKSLIEAALIDGASEWKVFLKICYPLSKNIAISAGLLVFYDYWSMVEQPVVLLADKYLYPLSVFLNEINRGEIGIAFAAATVYMIPGILLYIYGDDYLIEGISYQGGVKG